jgi:hypothetical protein
MTTGKKDFWQGAELLPIDEQRAGQDVGWWEFPNPHLDEYQAWRKAVRFPTQKQWSAWMVAHGGVYHAPATLYVPFKNGEPHGFNLAGKHVLDWLSWLEMHVSFTRVQFDEWMIDHDAKLATTS